MDLDLFSSCQHLHGHCVPVDSHRATSDTVSFEKGYIYSGLDLAQGQ